MAVFRLAAEAKHLGRKASEVSQESMLLRANVQLGTGTPKICKAVLHRHLLGVELRCRIVGAGMKI